MSGQYSGNGKHSNLQQGNQSGHQGNQNILQTHKKLIAITCAIFLFLCCVAGCSKNTSSTHYDAPDSSSDSVQVQSSDAAVSTPAPATDPQPAQTQGTLRVHYLNVGQGDSEFIELPNGTCMLIDAGVADAGQDIVNYIKGLGYSHIDYLVATHPHADHIGGMPAVLSAFTIGEVWAPKAVHTTKTYENFLDQIAAKGLTINTASTGKRIHDASGCTIDILSPSEGAQPKDLNDYSIVEQLTFGSKTYLFTGDASSSVTIPVCKQHVDVLKVAHHGSKTGTNAALIAQLTPTYAVISCGAGNSYGHPHQEAISALASSSIYRTDQDGTITSTFDGSNITFSTEKTHSASASTIIGSAAGSAAASSGSSSSSASSAPSSATSSNTSSSADDNTIVYVTKSGKKYHMDGCASLSKSKIPMTLGEAKSKGYTPCSKCNPPA